MDKDRFQDFDEEERQLVLDFENTVLKGGMQFFDVDELEVIIDYYFEVNDLKPLQRAVEYAEQLYPDSTIVRLRRAHLMIANQDFEPALRIIQQLRRQEPNNTDVAYSLGVAYGAMGEHEKAIQHYLEAANDGWLLGRVYANIAEEYYQMLDYTEALRYYKLSLDTDSYDTSTLYNYLDTALQAQQIDDAIGYLKSFVGEHPYCSEAWQCLGTAYRDLGLFEQAEDAYEYAIAIDKKNAGAYSDLAVALEMNDQPAKAVSTLLRAQDYVTSRSNLFRQVAYIYLRSGNNETALLYLRKSVEEDPEDAASMATLALAYAFSNDLDMALTTIRKALRVNAQSADVLSIAATIYDMRGNFEAASDYFERAIGAEDCTEPICQEYLKFLYQHKVYDILIDFGTESLELYPNHPFYCTFLAAAYFYTNRYNRASRVLPHVDPELLAEICPEIVVHPRLGPLVPSVKDS
ncbi:MAG: tetratricopeptide repeat protein [Bacteroidales bacterium]|nr:tetratricopeptide repeat protein [Bacteroidales bacterium]